MTQQLKQMTTLTLSKLEGLLEAFFEHEIILKLYHFHTKRYGAHKASDAYRSKFLANMDQFMEVAQGIVGTVKQRDIQVNARMVSDSTVGKQLDSFIKLVNSARFKAHPELHAIIDIMVADANQLKYLLTFE
jgi:hypothetical protein